MIQLDQLSIRRGGRVLFQKASMQLHPGWKIGLTGVNGAGKSTLFSALLGGMESDGGSLTRPSVHSSGGIPCIQGFKTREKGKRYYR